MKELFLLRHAKSSWDDPSVSDFDRPLNRRGKEDAPKIGAYLASLEVGFDLMVASPAKRAKQTALAVAKEIGYDAQRIVWDEGIYEASVQALQYRVCAFDPTAKRVLMVGHNPGLTMLSNLLGDIVIDNIPTAGVVAMTFDLKKWDEVCKSKGHTILFDYPKKLWRKGQ